MTYIMAPTRGTVTRELIADAKIARSADELLNLVDHMDLFNLATGGDGYVVDANADYTPPILKQHVQAALLKLVRDGWIMPNQRAEFEIAVKPETKADAKKGIEYDPGYVAVFRNDPDPLRLAGTAADGAHRELMSATKSVPSYAVSARKRALAEAQIADRFTIEHVAAEVAQS